MRKYPREICTANEDVTRTNKAEHDARRKAFYAECERRNPDYWKLSLRERAAIRREIENETWFCCPY